MVCNCCSMVDILDSTKPRVVCVVREVSDLGGGLTMSGWIVVDGLLGVGPVVRNVETESVSMLVKVLR